MRLHAGPHAFMGKYTPQWTVSRTAGNSKFYPAQYLVVRMYSDFLTKTIVRSGRARRVGGGTMYARYTGIIIKDTT